MPTGIRYEKEMWRTVVTKHEPCKLPRRTLLMAKDEVATFGPKSDGHAMTKQSKSERTPELNEEQS